MFFNDNEKDPEKILMLGTHAFNDPKCFCDVRVNIFLNKIPTDSKRFLLFKFLHSSDLKNSLKLEF